MKNPVLQLSRSVLVPLLLCTPSIVSSHEIPVQPARSAVEISYGLTSLTMQDGPVSEIKLSREAEQQGKSFSFFKTAEAAMPNGFTPAVYEKICTTIRDAGQLNDLKPVLSESYFQTLKARTAAKSSQYTVLTMMQEMRPKDLRILDAKVAGDKAELAVAGKSYLGEMQGLANLVFVDGIWKVEREQWVLGERDKNDPLNTVLKASKVNERRGTSSIEILNKISPDYDVNRNFLELTPVPNDRRKKTIMFVFMMNGDKKQQVEDPTDKLNPRIKKHRARMHILVPGAKRVLQEQKLIENEYPVDVSVAKYEDGYAPKEWNMVLPGKKPREVRVSFMWSF